MYTNFIYIQEKNCRFKDLRYKFFNLKITKDLWPLNMGNSKLQYKPIYGDFHLGQRMTKII